MRKKKKEQLKTEAKKFSFVGAISTVLDYGILNVLVIFLGVPAIPANLVSTTISSSVSYRLNKKHTFEGRRHSPHKALLLYALIIGTGIYIIQNSLILLLQPMLAPLAEVIASLFHINPDVLGINLAKMCSGFFVGLWNYVMLRHFVFVPETQKKQVKVAG